MDHVGRDGAQRIVVSKFDFRYRDGIILIDNGYHSHRQELRECVLSIEIPLTLYRERGKGRCISTECCPYGSGELLHRVSHITDVLPRQQDLSNRLANHAKQVIKHGYQPALAYGGQGLFPLQTLALFPELHPSESDPDSARGDEDDLVVVWRGLQFMNKVD